MEKKQEQPPKGMDPLLQGGDLDMLQTPRAEWDLLLSAAQKNNVSQLRAMIYSGVPATYSNGIRQTALHIAVLWGHVECVQALIELDANVNAVNSLMGSTPLHTTLSSHKTTAETKERIVALLLEAGADPSIEDFNRRAPATYVPQDHPNRAKLMRKLKPPPRDAAQFMSLLQNDVASSLPMCRIAGPPGSA